MSTSITLNAGDTFRADCVYKDSTGAAVNLDTAGITVAAEVRSPDGETTLDCDVTLANQSTSAGQFTVRSDTADWVWGSAGSVVIRYTASDGEKFSSRRFDVVLK